MVISGYVCMYLQSSLPGAVATELEIRTGSTGRSSHVCDFLPCLRPASSSLVRERIYAPDPHKQLLHPAQVPGSSPMPSITAIGMSQPAELQCDQATGQALPPQPSARWRRSLLALQPTARPREIWVAHHTRPEISDPASQPNICSSARAECLAGQGTRARATRTCTHTYTYLRSPSSS